MNLSKLSTYIEKINNDVEYELLSKEEAFDKIVYYSEFVNTELRLDMFVGENRIFEGKFKESDCWSAGYDNHRDGPFIETDIPPYGKDIIEIDDKTIEWFIESYSHSEIPTLTQSAIRAFNLNTLLL